MLAAPCEFGRQRMRAEKRRAHGDGAKLAKPARDGERLAFRPEFEPIAGFDLDCRDALGDERVEPFEGARGELFLARRPGGAHGRENAAAGARNLLIGRAFEAHLELAGAVSPIDEMGMAIDEAGRDPAALTIHNASGARANRERQLRLGARKNDSALPRRERALFDHAEARRVRRKGRETGVQPDRIDPLIHFAPAASS